MIRFKIESTSYDLPTEWSEVTVGHFIKEEFLSGDSLKLLAALSSIPIQKLACTTEDLMPKFNKAVKFLKDDPNGWRGVDEIPTTLTLLDKECIIPTNIEMKMLGQKIMLSQELAKHKYYYAAIPQAIAIYLGPQIYEDWYDRIPEISEAVMLLPISQVYNIADFFLTNIEELYKSGNLS